MKLCQSPYAILALLVTAGQSGNARVLRAADSDPGDPVAIPTTSQCGDWLPRDLRVADQYTRDLKRAADRNRQRLVQPVARLKEMIEKDKHLNTMANAMFVRSARVEGQTPVGTPSLTCFDDFIVVLNHIVTSVVPEFTVCQDNKAVSLEPCGMIGTPINAMLVWPMATPAGYNLFSNQLFNQQFKKVLTYWTELLNSSKSTFTLTDSDLDKQPPAHAWLSDHAREELVDVVNSATGAAVKPTKFEEIFQADPDAGETWGFKSWDDFFVRHFRQGVRPVEDPNDPNVIVSACEAAPLQLVSGVKFDDKFWLKGQPYSLDDMLASHPFAKKFIGGTIYQAFLSALSYHRWNSPIDGTVVDAFNVDGTYFLTNRYTGFQGPDPDEDAPLETQPFLSAVAARAVMFIEADNPSIGLMAFIAIGMVEVSSCEVTAQVGQHVKKGDELGMFHFGGSTHILLFHKDVELVFIEEITKKAGVDAPNVAVSSKIATVIPK